MPASHLLRLHHIQNHSLANGPGERIVLWTQGCTLACPGCFNPQTHHVDGGSLWNVHDLARLLLSAPGHPEGLTISGGEPLQQSIPLLQLLKIIHKASTLSIILFTGLTWPEVHKIPRAMEVLANCDVLLAGRYLSTHHLASGLLGSSNKTVHFLTNRYTQADLDDIPPAEVWLSPGGNLTISGIDPLKL